MNVRGERLSTMKNSAQSKICKECEQPMHLERRGKPEGPAPMAVGEEWWVCPKGHLELAK